MAENGRNRRLHVITSICGVSISMVIGLIWLMGSLVEVQAAPTPPMDFPEYDRQPITQHANMPLSGTEQIWDFEFARLISSSIGLSNCHSMKFVFGQCYGGGMIDDLAALGITCTLSAQSAARANEWSYGDKGGGEEHYLRALARILEISPTLPLREAARLARQQDPSGPNSHWPEAEKEHPQYYASGPLTPTVSITGARSFHAVLLAGRPDGARHWNDLLRMYKLLTSTYGYTGANATINVLYGNGHWPTGVDNGGDAFPANPGIPISAATRSNLTNTLKAVGKRMNANEQFFFWSSDHGGMGVVPISTIPSTPAGTGGCSGGRNCAFTMTLSLTDQELAFVTTGASLEASIFPSLGSGPPPLVNVYFNEQQIETFTAAQIGHKRIPLAPLLFHKENNIEFRIQGSPSQLVQLQITDALVDFGALPEAVHAVNPVAFVELTGPLTGTVNTSYTFTAAVEPIRGTGVITYSWQATDHTALSNVMHQTALEDNATISNTVIFTWTTPGVKTVKATAANAGNTVTANYTITIAPLPAVDHKLYLPVVQKK